MLLTHLSPQLQQFLVVDVAAAAPPPDGGDSGGLLDWIDAKTGDATSTLKNVAGLLAIGFCIYTAIRSKGVLVPVLMSGLSAAIFLWLTGNIGDVSDRVDNEVNSSPPIHTVYAPHAAAGSVLDSR